MRSLLRVGVMAATLCSVPAATVSAQKLEPVLQGVAQAWHRGNVGAITGISARAGISLDVDGNSVGPLGPRQSAAVLRRVFEGRQSVSAAPSMSRTVGGQPARAFGEITWTMRARGTTIPERATVFVAFVQEGDSWRITEIRLMQ